MMTFVSNTSHYKEVLSRVQSVKHTLWIGTADIKDLYVNVNGEVKPLLEIIALLIRRGAELPHREQWKDKRRKLKQSQLGGQLQ